MLKFRFDEVIEIDHEYSGPQLAGMVVIRDYDFSEVKEKILQEGSISFLEVDEAIEEFRKFLILIRLGHRGLAMCSPVVDEVWHTFILFTRDYASFCSSAFGAFLHHQPKTSRMPIAKDATRKFYESYQSVFGDVPRIWHGGIQGLAECEGTTNCQDYDCYVDPQ